MNAKEVVELLFADQSDEEIENLDDDDINVLDDAFHENREAVIINMDPDVPEPSLDESLASGSHGEQSSAPGPSREQFCAPSPSAVQQRPASRKRHFSAASAFAAARANATATAHGDNRLSTCK